MIHIAEIGSYRSQTVRHIILHRDSLPPPPPVPQPPDDSYATLLKQLQRKDQTGITIAISQIVAFGLDETDDQLFEQGGSRSSNWRPTRLWRHSWTEDT